MQNRNAAILALITGCFIAGYSLVVSYGARQAETALGFFGWLSIINTIVFSLVINYVKPGVLHSVAKKGTKAALLGGGSSFATYCIVVWAFTQAPIALVTALREISIVFALLIGVFFLNERLNIAKVLSTFLALFGAILLSYTR